MANLSKKIEEKSYFLKEMKHLYNQITYFDVLQGFCPVLRFYKKYASLFVCFDLTS